jgi:hypothetical protein
MVAPGMALSTKEHAATRAQTLIIAATATSNFMNPPSTKPVRAFLFAMVRESLTDP